jgi:hypothetical protein
VKPGTTTTYGFTCRGVGPDAVGSVTVVVKAGLTIALFQVKPACLLAGKPQTIQIEWRALNATERYLIWDSMPETCPAWGEEPIRLVSAEGSAKVPGCCCGGEKSHFFRFVIRRPGEEVKEERVIPVKSQCP